MSTCSDDARLTGPVAMFLGVETSKWTIQQFVDAANFCMQHHVSTLFIKVFEVGSSAGDSQGIWYGGINSWDAIYQEVSKIVNVVPYGFLYGDTFNNLSTEIATATQLLQKYGKLCLDMEGSYWNNTNSAIWAGQLSSALVPVPGKLWLSCPANPKESGDLPYIQALSPAVNIYMPMVYSDYLNTTWVHDFAVPECIQPTLDLSQEFGPNNIQPIVQSWKATGVLALSCWYYGFAVQNPSLLDQVVQEFTVGQTTGGTSLQLDNNGCVMTVPKSFQLETEQLANVPGSPQGKQESQDLCGPWGAYASSESVPPGHQQKDTQENVDRYVDDMVDNLFGPSGFNHINFGGVLPDDMIKIFNYIRDDRHTLHYQTVSATLDNLYKIIDAGYIGLFSCNEADVTAWNKTTNAWEHAYPWQLSAGHVFPAAGYEKNTKNLICPDELNNSYQGYWPPIYKASDIGRSLTWMAAIQVVGPDANNPWLKAIPSGDPATWPQGFNAQNFSGGTQVTTTPPQPTVTIEQIAQKIWGSTNTGSPTGTGIYNAWLADYKASKFHGPPLTKEFSNDNWSQKPVTCQVFCSGQYEWDTSAHWYPYQ